MTGVQRACLVGALIWLFSHGPLVAVLSLNQHPHPWLAVVALVVVLATSAWAIRPLLGRPLDLPLSQALAMATVVPLAGLALTPFLDPSVWRTYANWWPGLTQIIVSALIMRRRWLPALLAELASAVVLGVCVLTSDLPNRAIAFAALNQPAIVWFSATLGVRYLFDRTARDVARFAADTGRAVAARAATEAREASAEERRSDLEHSAVPLLRRVSGAPADAPTWPLLSRAALSLERRLRDDLRARELLDDSVRTALRQARDRGCEVDVVDDRARPDGREFLADLRTVVAPVLAACGTARVTLRLPPDGSHATLSVDGTPAEADEVATTLRLAVLRGLALDVRTDVSDGSLWCELRRA